MDEARLLSSQRGYSFRSDPPFPLLIQLVERISGIKGHDERASKINGHPVVRPLLKRNARKSDQPLFRPAARGCSATFH
jgi:hypothetical protein